MKSRFAGKVLLPAFLCAVATFLAGCKTSPSADWSSRIGKCTLDQAVAELGSPNKETKFSDGKLAAQWITLHGNDGYYMGGGPAYGGYDMGSGQYLGQNYQDHVLELTFGPDGKLLSVAKNY